MQKQLDEVRLGGPSLAVIHPRGNLTLVASVTAAAEGGASEAGEEER